MTKAAALIVSLVVAILLACAGAAWMGYKIGRANGDQQVADIRVKMESANREAEHQARIIEEQHAEHNARVDAQYQEELKNAYEEGQSVADNLRAGNLRLRKQWRGCEARPVPEAVGDLVGGDENAQLREKDSGDLVRVGIEADAQVRACQAILKDERAPAT